jgi:hypothetical protein
MNLADAMHAEAEDKMGEELIQFNGKILYKKDNVQNMPQMLMNSDDLNMLVPARVALEEANKAVNTSCIRIIGLHKKLELTL